MEVYARLISLAIFYDIYLLLFWKMKNYLYKFSKVEELKGAFRQPNDRN
jgi:hypothetical protein